MSPGGLAAAAVQPQERDGPCLLGIGFDGAIPFTSSTGVRVLSEAILYRVFKVYPAYPRGEAFDHATSLLTSRFILGGFEKVKPMDTWEWLMSYRNARRKRILIKAWRERTCRGEPHQDFEWIQPFGKTENLPWFTIVDGHPVSGVKYVPRLIQAPHDETHLIAGPYLKPLTHALKKHWNHRNWLFYASAVPEVLDEWLRSVQHARSFFWSDYSAFDATWSKRAWQMVESFYRDVLEFTTDEFWRVLDIWRTPKGKTRCKKDEVKIAYQSDECNASGRDDTALANALLNGIAQALSITAAMFGVRVWEVTPDMLAIAQEHVRIAVVGDDSLVACDFDVEPVRAQIIRNLEDFGLCVKAASSPHLWDVTFLGQMPYLAGGQLFWGPTLGRRLYKAFWKADRVGHLCAWARGVAQQMSLNRHVPILREIGERVMELTKHHPVSDLKDENKLWTSRTSPTLPWDEGTIEWMTRRYSSLSRGMFQADLDVIRLVNRLPAVIHSEVFTACVAVDDL